MSIDGKGGRWTTILLVAGVMFFVFGLAGLIDDRFVLSRSVWNARVFGGSIPEQTI